MHWVIAETVAILEHSLDKRISVEQHVVQAAVITGDPSQLQSALLNLSLNARDAMPGSGTLTFETALSGSGGSGCEHCHNEVLDGPHLRITVGDTGCGMDEEARKHLFEPFFTTKPIGKGTGMGLASVYGTVKSHGGSIRVDSGKGVGTKVTICLPLAESSGPEESRVDPERPTVDHRLRVLFVDDEESLRAMSPRMLGPRRCRDGGRLERGGGRRALLEAMARDRSRDPRHDDAGDDRERHVPGASGDPRRRACSSRRGTASTARRRKILDEGASGFIQKPFLTAELEAAIAEVVEAG